MNIELKEVSIINHAHGCDECRSKAAREKLIAHMLEAGRGAEPQALQCRQCAALWLVTFEADAAGFALIKFSPATMRETETLCGALCDPGMPCTEPKDHSGCHRHGEALSWPRESWDR